MAFTDAAAAAHPQQGFLLEPADEDVELSAPAQRRMEEAPVHAAWWSPINAGNPSQPTTSDSLYTKVICVTCGIGELLGKMVIGETHTCFCIKGQALLGLGGPDGCPAAESGCDMYKPTGECHGSVKLLCIKAAVDCPEKPWLVCNGKTIA
mmetsp:Transcript_57608/g.129905  ORF Transcript_57608/g.129905 Transcript_57608/m.129905 type:complete len:151 (-) Transcript_57608:89-541(-)